MQHPGALQLLGLSSLPLKHTHTHTHAHTHADTHAHTHTHFRNSRYQLSFPQIHTHSPTQTHSHRYTHTQWHTPSQTVSQTADITLTNLCWNMVWWNCSYYNALCLSGLKHCILISGSVMVIQNRSSVPTLICKLVQSFSFFCYLVFLLLCEKEKTAKLFF